MDREFKQWFITERARALAMILLTRRDDLEVKETSEENGLDFTVYIKADADSGNRPFGVYVAGGMTPATLDAAGQYMKPALEKVQSIGPFPFPVCLFYFTVKHDKGYCAWVYEPAVTRKGHRLMCHSEPRSRKLDDESLGEIVAAVKQWYSVFYGDMTE
jgi:hypothetical protein